MDPATTQANHPVAVSTDLRTSRLGTRELAALTDLCARCAPFFAMMHGAIDPSRVAKEILSSLPPGGTPDGKHLFGFWQRRLLIGTMDLAADYPRANEWYVALFIISPGARGLGLGRRLWEASEAWLAARGGTRIGLIVQQDNPGARRFWEARGFTVTGDTVQRVNAREHRVWSMGKELAPAAAT